MAIKGYFACVLWLVRGKVARRAYRSFGKDNGERCARRAVGYTAEVVHAHNVVREGSTGRVRVVARPWWFARTRVGQAEDLEGFKQGCKGDLEGWGSV